MSIIVVSCVSGSVIGVSVLYVVSKYDCRGPGDCGCVGGWVGHWGCWCIAGLCICIRN